MLTDIVGPEAIETFKREQMTDYFDLLRDFETKKRTITTTTDGKVTFKIPATLRELGESQGSKMQEKVARSGSKTKITWIGDKLRIEKAAAKALFETPLNDLVCHIGKMLADPIIQDIDAVLLVGGFGECELVKEVFEKHFANKRLMIPPEAGLAVLKGAVRFGHLQDIVTTRVARFTIGREIWPVFEEHHDPAKKVVCDGKEYCKDIFKNIIEINEEIPKYKFHQQMGRAVFADQKYCAIKLFSSTNRLVKYTTEPECQELGSLVIKCPDSSNISDKDHIIYYFFGDTEIHIRVKMLKTNEENEKWIDCFSS